MKYFCKLILIAAVCMQSIGILFAVPADKRPVTVKQKNGTVLTFILQGDETVNWAKTLDGYTLIRNKEGDFVYAHKNAANRLLRLI